MVLHADKRIFLLLHNPEVRQCKAALEPVRARYIAAGSTAVREPFETLPELALDITRLHQKADAMVVCGGDGSMSSAAPALIESGLLLGIIPADTANDLVRTSGISIDFEAAAAVILAAHAEPIGNGMVNGHAIAALRIKANARRLHARIQCNGRDFRVKTYQIASRNGRLYGAWQEVRTERLAEFETVTRCPMPINTDGERVTATPARFRVSSRAATFLHRKAAARPACILFANQSVGTTYLPLKPRNADHATFFGVKQIGLDNCGFDDRGFVRKLLETRVPFISQDCVKGA